jgi:hypothetical protein
LSIFEYSSVEIIEYSMRDKISKMETKSKMKRNPLIGD